MQIVNSSGTTVAQYAYNAWGSHTAIKDGNGNAVYASNTTHIANLNPFRYRGYYYDKESGFYYLNSRYYDSKTGRFINADGQLNTDAVLGTNLFAYCYNNPVMLCDSNGNRPILSTSTANETAEERRLSFAYMRQPVSSVLSDIIETDVIEYIDDIAGDFDLIYSIPTTKVNGQWANVGDISVNVRDKDSDVYDLLSEWTDLDVEVVKYRVDYSDISATWDEGAIYMKSTVCVIPYISVFGVFDYELGELVFNCKKTLR